MSRQDEGAPDIGDADAGAARNELDDAVRSLLAQGLGARDIADRLADLGEVAQAEVRRGLVKTDPPVLELVVVRTTKAGGTATRVYDLAQLPDGSLEWAGEHPG